MLQKVQNEAPAKQRICDPITLEIVRGALKAAMQEMEALIERTAMSPFIREKKDFQTSIYDGEGRAVYNNTMLVADSAVETVFKEFPRETMRDGDLYWYNDCYASNGVITHSPDQVFLMPVFAGGEIVAFTQTWAHFNDIGGMRPGSISSDCVEIYQEGIIVPPVKLVDRGRVAEDLLRLFCRNSRFPEMVKGDVRALMAATTLGKRRIEEISERFGRECLDDAYDQLIERTAHNVRSRMKELFPDGVYKTSETMDSDGQGNGPFKLRYALHVKDGDVVLDTTESDDQTPGPINFLLNPGCAASMLGDFLVGGDKSSISNAGLLAALDEVKVREGSIFRPRFPAPLGFRGTTLMRHLAGMMALVALASHGQSGAASSAYVIYYMRGLRENGKPFLLSDGIGVGNGARTFSDGNDAIYGPANENYPCEFVDANYPVRMRRYEIRRDTGGPGRYRGGCGVIRELEILADSANVSMRIDATKTPPWGVNGGMAGRLGACLINPGTDRERSVEGVSDGTILKRGDVLCVMTAGGGGWGHPFDREPERVLADVLDNFVSVESAHEDYGVIIDPVRFIIDQDATAKTRKERPAAKLFHQMGYKEFLG